MAQRKPTRQQNIPYGGRVVGNLAYDYDYEQREELRRAPKKTAPPPRPKAQPKPQQKQQPKPKPVVRVRERERLSPSLVLGLAALCGMVMLLLAGYASLASTSAEVVALQSELSELQDENVSLLTDYEKTFDINTVKEAARAAGMTEPSASQISRIDLSEPDSVVVYETQEASLLSRVFTSLGHSVGNVLEYFS